MPEIKVVYWNIEHFGNAGPFRDNSVPLIGFIADVVQNVRPDVFFIMELQQPGIALLPGLQAALNALPGPLNNWYYDVVVGSVGDEAAARQVLIPPIRPPFERRADLEWMGNANNEGYVMFWNQNIAKFTMETSSPVLEPRFGAVPPFGVPAYPSHVNCTHSEVVRSMHNPGMGPVFGTALPAPGAGVTGSPTDGLVVPARPAPAVALAPRTGNFTLPIGTVIPAPGIMRGGAVLVAAVAAPGLVAAENLNSGDVIPSGTTIGPGGMTVNLVAAAYAGYNNVVIPGGYRIPAGDSLRLPEPGRTLVPYHALQLSIIGRAFSIVRENVDSSTTVNRSQEAPYVSGNNSGVIYDIQGRSFAPGANPPGSGNPWTYLPFVADNRARARFAFGGTRRPAFCTIRVNNAIVEEALYLARQNEMLMAATPLTVANAANAVLPVALQAHVTAARTAAGATPASVLGAVSRIAAGESLIPLMVFHAPSKKEGSKAGILMAGLSHCLYQAWNWDTDARFRAWVDNDKVVAGGDWNTRYTNLANEPYERFTNALVIPASFLNGGAGCQARIVSAPPAAAPVFPAAALPLTSADEPANKTSVALNDPIVPQRANMNVVMSNVSDHFKRGTLDNIFFRGNFFATPNHTFNQTPLPVLGVAAPQQTFDSDIYDYLPALMQENPGIAAPHAVAPLAALPDNYFFPIATIQAFQHVPFLTPPVAGVMGPYLPAPPVFPVAGLPQILSPARFLADVQAGFFQDVAAGNPQIGGPLPRGVGVRGPVAIAAPAAPAPRIAPAAAPLVTGERRAAEFVRKFISDHLPVIFTMQV